jgi:small-conductance mechanosensitive channel
VVLLSRLVRLLGIIGALLLMLSVAGVEVGSVLAALAVAGVAVGLAVQGILENFIAGVILLVRKPFSAGDQVRSGEFEGTVESIDLRVTNLIDYDGEIILIPNRDVYNDPLVNLTRRGKRRTVVVVGVDYRDDHDDARAVIFDAVRSVEGVLDHPEPEVLLTELGESSVNFEVRYWTRPDIRSVRRTQDRVLAAAKRGIQDAGMTIPWPIRTLVPDGTFHTTRREPPRA